MGADGRGAEEGSRGSRSDQSDSSADDFSELIFTLWTIALQDLKLPERRFWQLTFREFDALIERRQLIRTVEVDLPQAHLCSVLANLQRDDREHPEPYTLEQFMLWPTNPRKELTPDEVLIEKLKALTIMLGGEVNI